MKLPNAVLFGILCIACQAKHGTSESSSSAAPAPIGMAAKTDSSASDLPPQTGGAPVDASAAPDDASTEPVSPGRFPPWDWCQRMAAEPGAGIEVAYEIADAYWTDQEADCQTAGLTLNSLTGADDDSAWFNYLIGYTYLLLGCPLFDEPVQGGTAVFGPANVAAVGKASPVLSSTEVDLLLADYEKEFLLIVDLSTDERAQLDAYLKSAAALQTSPDAAGGLSLCAVDAGVGAEAGASERD